MIKNDKKQDKRSVITISMWNNVRNCSPTINAVGSFRYLFTSKWWVQIFYLAMSLKQGRYTWRHDSILQRLVEDLKSFVGCANSGTVANISIEKTFIKFVREGKQPSKRRVPHKSKLLFTANDWVLAYDDPHNPLVIPPHIVQTSLCPDIIIYSNATKQVFHPRTYCPSGG